jgi:hypothetical protein
VSYAREPKMRLSGTNLGPLQSLTQNILSATSLDDLH